MPRKRIVKKYKYDIDVLWSKGFNLIDGYALTSTGRGNSDNCIIEAINKFDNIIYIKSGQDIDTFSRYLDKLDKPKILLTTDGDGGFPSSHNLETANKIINNPFITKWYIQNFENNLGSDKVKPFPIGLDLHTSAWKIGKTPQEKINYMINLNIKKKKKTEF